MWSTDTFWFDVSLITGITALGSIYFGHFELHTPKWRRVVKLIMFIVIAVTLTATAGRMWTFIFLGVMLLAVVVVHVFVLPSKGINGLTGEPKEKYYKFRGWDKYL
jgi:hypothetical protein